MPSIAILIDNMVHEKFAEVSLLLKKESIDPEIDKRNYAFSRDIWSATYPEVITEDGKDYVIDPQTKEKYEFSLENVVKAMLKSKEDGRIKNALRDEEAKGIDRLLIEMAIEFSNIDEMHKNKSRIRLDSEYDNKLKKIKDERISLLESDELKDKTAQAERLFIDIAKTRGFSEENILNTFKGASINISPSTAKDIAEWFKKIDELPSLYFESKPARVLKLDEILEAIIPKTKNGEENEELLELIDALNEAGIPWSYYEEGSKESRNVAINRAADKHNARFSISRGSRIKTAEETLKEGKKKAEKELKEAEKTVKKLNAKNEALAIEIEKLKSENKISRRSKTKKQIDINLVDKAGKKWLDQFANKVKYADIRGRVLEVAREVSKAIFTENVADALEDAMMVASPLAFDMAMETLHKTGNKSYINPFDVEVYELADEMARELILLMTSDPNLYNKRTAEDIRKDEAAENRRTISGLKDSLQTATDSIISKDAKIKELREDIKDAKTKLAKAKTAHETATGKLKTEYGKEINKLNSKIAELSATLEVEKVSNAMQSKAMQKMLDIVKRERDKAQQRADHLKEAADKKRDKAKVKEQRDRLERKVKKLSSLLRNPTDDKHVPEQLRAVTAQVLSLINMSSSEMRDAKGVTKKTIAFQELRNYYIENYTNVVIDDSVFDAGGLIDQVEKLADKSYMDMTEEELISCIELVDAMSAAIKNYNTLFATERWSGVHEISNQLREDNGSKKTPTKLVGALGALQKLVKIDMMEPLTYFHNLGEAGDGIFRMLRDAQDKFTTIVKMASDFSMEVTKGIKPKKLEKLIVKVKLGGKEVKMPTAHLMNLYVLSKRPSGLNHILNGGIKQSKRTKGLKVIEAPVAIKNITMEELNEAFSKIPAPAIAVADALQKFVSITLGDIQNEASLSVFGIKKFNEEVYWRIRVDKSHLKDDVTQFKGDVTTIRGMGHAKALKENASQPVIIESIFDAFSGMVVDGAKYAAYLKVTVDVDRIRNYKFDPETESEYSDIETMKELLDTVYGSGEGTGYLRKLLSDISSGVSGIDAEAGFTDKLVSNFKGAAIGANLRVVIQQPTALLRAVEAIGAGYFVGELPVIDYIRGWKRAVEHSPIAQWKDWGYFDVQTGRQIKDVLFRTLSNVNKVKEASMILVGAADSVSWGCIWMACENKVKHTRKDLKVNTDEYFAAVNEIFTDVIDRTQVVDGVLQRTQVMRSANPMVKQATSFMAEPMKQWNMMIRSLLDIANKKKGAKGHFLRTVVVLGASVTLNAAAQSVMDAIRDDNREEKWLEKWLRSMLGYNQNDAGDMTDIDKLKAFAFSNLGSTLNAGNYIPYVKDVFSLLQGYEIKRMDFDNISKFIKSGNYLLKALKGEGETTVQSALVDFISYGAQVTGMPLYNLRREILTWTEFVANQTDDYELQYMLTAYKNVLGADTTSSKYYDLLWKTLDMNSGSYDKVRAAILNTLIADGMTEAEANKKIVDQLSKRLGSSTTLDMMLTSSLSDFEAIRADAVDKLVKAGMSESDANKTVVKGLAQRMKNAGLFSQLHDTTDQASYEAIYNDALDRVLAAGYQLSDSAMSKLKEQGATASEIEAARREAADAWLNNQVKGKDKTFMAPAAKSAYEQYTTALKSSSVYTNLDANKQAKVDDLAKQLAEGKGDQYAKLKAATDAGVSGTNLLLFEAALKASDKNGDGKYNQMEFLDAKNMGAISASDARLLWTAWQVSWSPTKNQQAFTMEEVEASKKYADWRAGK